MTDKEKISEFAGMIQEEFIRQTDMIQCGNADLRRWVVYMIKKKLLTENVTYSIADGWLTGGDILFEATLDQEEELNDVFVTEHRTEIFNEARRLIENEA